MAGIQPHFANLSGSDFVELSDWFAINAEGYIHIEDEGVYDFRLWSDDGSKLYLHGKNVIDHDGMHATSMKETRVALDKGYHPFTIEYFQGAGGKFLSLNYKKANDDLVPEEFRAVGAHGGALDGLRRR